MIITFLSYIKDPRYDHYNNEKDDDNDVGENGDYYDDDNYDNNNNDDDGDYDDGDNYVNDA